MEITNKLKLIDHGTMLTDYFCGTSGVMLSISIDNKTTIKEVIERLEQEINMIWDHIEYTAQYHNYIGDLNADIDKLLSDLKNENQDQMSKIVNPGLDFCFEDIQDNEEFEEYPVLILSIEFIEE